MRDPDFNILDLLRDAQDRQQPRQELVPFDIWHKERHLGKAVTGGMSNPGLGMMGPGPGYTSSYAPTGPNHRRSGNQGVGFSGSQSKYDMERPEQPPPYIDDVNMSSIWYSPMEPVWPYGPPYINRPRDWNFPVGYNLNYIPERIGLYETLRGMRKSWGVLATIIETRKDQLLRLPWTIQRIDKPRGTSRSINDARKFFKRPDGSHSYSQWSRLILDDLFTIDAPCLYLNRNMGGKLRHAEHIDGGTIFPLIDDAGRRPSTDYEMVDGGIEYQRRQPAFQQIIYGLPMVNMSEDELIYAMMRPRGDLPIFGYSPVEQILIETTEAIRKTFYQLEFWRSGSIPDLIVTVPKEWTPRQISMFQAHFDSFMSGNLALKSKVRFLPGDMKPFDIKNSSGESLWSQRDETLIRLACYAFSVPPTPFVKQTNRSTAQNAQQSAQEEGLYPLMSWWKDDIMDHILQNVMGMEDVEFVFLPRPEVDLLKQSEIHKNKLQTGEMTIDEARAENGEEPYANGTGNVPLVYFGAGAVPLESIINGEAMLPGSPAAGNTGQQQGQPQKPEQSSANPLRGPATSRTATQPPSKPTTVHKVISADDLKDATDGATRDRSFLQVKNGNYEKGHFWWHGLNVSIENSKGSRRAGKDEFGAEREVKMPAAYGYIRGTSGADNMQVDVYVGKFPNSEVIYVIDQDKFDPQGKDHGFDEHKVMICYRSLKRAVKDYAKAHFDDLGHERISSITAVSIPDFKEWLADGDMMKPIAEQGIGVVVARRGAKGPIAAILKADTVSMSTNLLSYDQSTALPKKQRKKSRKKARREAGARWKEL